MPVATCDRDTLNRAAKCFACFSQKENQAAMVYFLEQARAKLASQTPLTPNQLRAAAACLGCIATDPTADALDAAVAQANAVDTGVSAQTTAQVRNSINALVNMPLDDLRSIEINLRCQLGAFLKP